jgi:serine/threonine protein kinase
MIKRLITRMETFCGTTGYASPEMLAGKKYLGVETDLWSMGIILYILLCGGLPFDDDDERVMKELILAGTYDEPEWLSDRGYSPIRPCGET